MSSLPGPQTSGCTLHQPRSTNFIGVRTPKQYPTRKKDVTMYATSLEMPKSARIERVADEGADEAKVLRGS